MAVFDSLQDEIIGVSLKADSHLALIIEWSAQRAYIQIQPFHLAVSQIPEDGGFALRPDAGSRRSELNSGFWLLNSDLWAAERPMSVLNQAQEPRTVTQNSVPNTMSGSLEREGGMGRRSVVRGQQSEDGGRR